MTPPPEDTAPTNTTSPTLTVKQQRAADREVKLAAFRKAQQRQKRQRLIGIITGSVAAVAVLGLLIGFVVTSATPKPDPSSIAIDGLQTYPGLTANHVTTAVDYPQNPPVGGDHAARWLNCGVYTESVPNENAVHALEHGAVWVAYDPAQLDEAALERVRSTLPDSYIVVSPVDDLDSPIVASAWGAQIALENADDPRLALFIDRFWRSNDAPEPGAACTGGIDAPGRVA
ncbi:DUF3105 domain-containing protein [Agreia sp. COWG]|uniref:DUF3105 domain-containing protein n=1 Tax=Agreia sp. COWG TaxID=2773266 RepID=UPI001F1C6753|nr:DUF3105 domain-containing protein [Agreia sp. COWG]